MGLVYGYARMRSQWAIPGRRTSMFAHVAPARLPSRATATGGRDLGQTSIWPGHCSRRPLVTILRPTRPQSVSPVRRGGGREPGRVFAREKVLCREAGGPGVNLSITTDDLCLDRHGGRVERAHPTPHLKVHPQHRTVGQPVMPSAHLCAAHWPLPSVAAAPVSRPHRDRTPSTRKLDTFGQLCLVICDTRGGCFRSGRAKFRDDPRNPLNRNDIAILVATRVLPAGCGAAGSKVSPGSAGAPAGGRGGAGREVATCDFLGFRARRWCL
jgi:hypothetical protein